MTVKTVHGCLRVGSQEAETSVRIQVCIACIGGVPQEVRESGQRGKELSKDVAPCNMKVWPDPQERALEHQSHGNTDPVRQRGLAFWTSVSGDARSSPRCRAYGRLLRSINPYPPKTVFWSGKGNCELLATNPHSTRSLGELVLALSGSFPVVWLRG